MGYKPLRLDVPFFRSFNTVDLDSGAEPAEKHLIADGAGKFKIDWPIFGHGLAQGASDGESNTTSTAWQQKLRVSTPASNPAARYIIFYQWRWSIGTANTHMRVQVQVDDVTTIISFNDSSSRNYIQGVYPLAGGFAVVSLTAGAHNIDMDWSSLVLGNTSYIRDARIAVWRVA